MKKTPREVLQERARALAEEGASRQERRGALTLFRRAGQLYGLHVDEVAGAGRLREMTPVPGGPGWLIGALPFRGSVLSLIDLPKLWGTESVGVADLPTYVVLADGERRVGVLVEELLGVQEIDGAPQPYQGLARAGLSEIARKSGQPVLVLSARELMQEPRLRA
jgi:purine-binding chemotaxis protein CheW